MKEEIRQAVIDTTTAIARARVPDRGPVAPTERLREDIGLDSLDLAQLVAELEVTLGFDPFQKQTVGRVVTVADVIAVYEANAPVRTSA
jgi:acyl carrier protein